jgi:hypothetical protein
MVANLASFSSVADTRGGFRRDPGAALGVWTVLCDRWQQRSRRSSPARGGETTSRACTELDVRGSLRRGWTPIQALGSQAAPDREEGALAGLLRQSVDALARLVGVVVAGGGSHAQHDRSRARETSVRMLGRGRRGVPRGATRAAGEGSRVGRPVAADCSGAARTRGYEAAPERRRLDGVGVPVSQGAASLGWTTARMATSNALPCRAFGISRARDQPGPWRRDDLHTAYAAAASRMGAGSTRP